MLLSCDGVLVYDSSALSVVNAITHSVYVLNYLKLHIMVLNSLYKLGKVDWFNSLALIYKTFFLEVRIN